MRNLLKTVLSSRMLLVPLTIVAVVASAAGFTAFEVHVVNVTATIDNALAVTPLSLGFDTVFSNEHLVYANTVDVSLSDSFTLQDRVNQVNYIVRQKPKCESQTIPGTFGRVIEVENDFVCEDVGFVKLPALCPFLSKSSPGDGTVESFHGSLAWTVEDTLETQAVGTLNNLDDLLDHWEIDLWVPPFQGQAAQDDPIEEEWHLDPGLQGDLFGCDLWVEVEGII